MKQPKLLDVPRSLSQWRWADREWLPDDLYKYSDADQMLQMYAASRSGKEDWLVASILCSAHS
jgi:hypothetical protein